MTELGEIPNEWHIKTINDLIKENIIIDVMDGNHGAIHPKASDYVDIGIPFIMANNLKNGKLDIEDCKFISYEQAKSLRKGFAIEGDVLLTHKGTLGETAIVPKLKYEYIMLTPQVTYYRLSENNVLINRYLKIYFDSKKYQDKLKSFGSQSTRDYVGIIEQRKLSIILPTIEEQEKISSILSKVDEQIDNVEALIKKNKELKKGLMQTLLTKGIGHTKFKKTEIGEVPEEWEIKQLGDIAQYINGKAFKPSEWHTEGLPIVRIQNLNGSKEFNYYNGVIEDKFIINKGQLLFSWSGSKRTSFGPFIWNNEKAVLNQHIFKVNLNENVDSFYGYYALKQVTQIIEESAHGSAGLVHVTKGTLEKFKIGVPKIEEQIKIASILLEVDERIDEYENKKQKLEKLKKGLMQQLLNGKIRV